MVKPLYQEDINELYFRLTESYPLLAVQLSDDDKDVLYDLIESFLDQFSHGYKNYN